MLGIDLLASGGSISNNASEEILKEYKNQFSNIDQLWDSMHKDYSTLVKTRVKETERLIDIIE
eukprot:Pgem_evm1s16971